MSTQTEQAAGHVPGPEVTALLALAESAKREIEQTQAILDRLCQLPVEGDFIRNGAIYTMRHVWAELTRFEEKAQEASATESSGQYYQKRAGELRAHAYDLTNLERAADEANMRSYEREAIKALEAAKRLANNARGYYSAGISLPLATVKGLLALYIQESTTK